MRGIAILGVTGSIGTQTLDVLEGMPEFRVVGMAAGHGSPHLGRIASRWRPQRVVLPDPEQASRLAQTGYDGAVDIGPSALEELVARADVEMVVAAMVGMQGLLPVLTALEAGKTVLLANKETLVAGGELVNALLRQGRGRLLPVDSEHSALFQCLQGEDPAAVARLVLTASGGPFRTWSRERMETARAADALRHPTWKMGPKITIDSATLMNKGLEIIEAHHLFQVEYERIAVVIHPESIIHSLVDFADGATVAQMGTPDMRVPIQYALTYPHRLPGRVPSLDWAEAGPLTFAAPREEEFPCLRLAREVGKIGGTFPAVLNAANEVAVAAFLDDAIPFFGIPRTIERVLEQHTPIFSPDLATIRSADGWARVRAREILSDWR